MQTNAVFAQQPAQSQRWVCLDAKWCNDQNSGCSKRDAHRAKLSVKQDVKPLANSDSYVIECLATQGGQICTTGNRDTDRRVYGVDTTGKTNVEKLSSVVQYRFEGIFQSDGTALAPNPSRSNNAGIIGPFEWQSYTPSTISRKFIALNYFTQNNVTGSEGGQQQGTFSFENASRTCVAINWDPYGRVFDSQTLEPIPDSIVTLLQKRQDDSFSRVIADDILGGNIENPQTTKENGAFSYVVPDNIYRITVSKSEYIFPNVLTKLNPAYSRIYSDIYRGEEIIQQGRIQHRDIPLDHVGSGKTYPMVINYFYETDKVGKGIIEGQSSHPFVLIKAYSVKVNSSVGQAEPSRTRYRLLKTINADKNGSFKIEINQSNFESNEVFGEIEVQKTDLLTQSSVSQNFFEKILSPVQAAETTTLKFEPIPTYIEGFTYVSGQVMPSTKVGVYLTFSEKPYYETQSDEKGYFKISSENLPTMPYKLRYGLAGFQTTVSTSKFIAQNAKYIGSNNIKVNTFQDINGKTQITSSPSPKKSLFPTSTVNKNYSNDQKNKDSQQYNANPSSVPQSGMLLILLIILVLLGGAAFLLGFYLYNKNRMPPQMM